MKTPITKFKYKLMVWGCIIGGLIANSIFYQISMQTLERKELVLGGYLVVAGIVIGYGCGLAISRAYKIEGIDK